MGKYLCIVCGNLNKKWIFKKIISNELAKQWKLTQEVRLKLDQRESNFCPKCGNSSRTRTLAQALMQQIQYKGIENFSQWINKTNNEKLKIAEINACGKLHKFLSKNKNIAYSEYPSSRLITRIINTLRNILKEDITQLTYPDNLFDIVLHSEVLEHVPDIDKAITECRRILKPKGICIFTIPILNNRKTKKCANINMLTGEIKYLKSPSYHGLDKRNDNLVWWEFGSDIIKKYKMEILKYVPEELTYVLSIRKTN